MTGKTYISGPISAPTPEKRAANLAKFHEAEAALVALGHSVANPAKNGLPESAHWEEHMRADIKLLMDCDTVALLDGWADSRGARIEYQLAKDLGLRVVPLVILLSQP